MSNWSYSLKLNIADQTSTVTHVELMCVHFWATR